MNETEKFELMSFKFPKSFCESLRKLKVLYGEDMALLIIKAVTTYYEGEPIGVKHES